MTVLENIPEPINFNPISELSLKELYRLGYLIDNRSSIQVKQEGKARLIFRVDDPEDARLLLKATQGSIYKGGKQYVCQIGKERIISLESIIDNYVFVAKSKLKYYVKILKTNTYSQIKINREVIAKEIKNIPDNLLSGQEPKEYTIQYLTFKQLFNAGKCYNKYYAYIASRSNYNTYNTNLETILKLYGYNFSKIIRSTGTELRLSKEESIKFALEVYNYTKNNFYYNFYEFANGQNTSELLKIIQDYKENNIQDEILSYIPNDLKAQEAKLKQEELKRSKAKEIEQRTQERKIRLLKEINIKEEQKQQRKLESQAYKAIKSQAQKLEKKREAKTLEYQELFTNTRCCISCRQNKTLDLFGEQKQCRLSKKYICKQCSYTKYVNKEEANKKVKKWNKENPEKAKETRKKQKSRPEIKARRNLKTRFREHWNNPNQETFRSFLGCSVKELKNYFEKNFNNGMTWENYGKKWHIDHIVPCAAFELNNSTHAKICWNYRNLTPRISEENCQKSDALDNGVSCRILKRENYSLFKELVNNSLTKLGLPKAYIN